MKDGDYCFLISPEVEAILHLTSKERWKIKYRTERLKRRGIFEPIPKVEMCKLDGFVFRERGGDR